MFNVRNAPAAFIMIASTVLALSIARALPSRTEKQMGCNELATIFQTELTVPYKTFSDKRVEKCVEGQTVNSVNMPLYIATAFYDRNLSVREKALNKLKAYPCATENTCKKLFGYIDAHLKATILTKTIDTRELFAELDSFREQLHYDLNSDL